MVERWTARRASGKARNEGSMFRMVLAGNGGSGKSEGFNSCESESTFSSES